MNVKMLRIILFLMLFAVQVSLVLGQNAASTAFIEDPFDYQDEYKLDPSKLTAEENTALPYVRECAKSYGISPALLMAIIDRESGINPDAVGDGGLAIGYMQLHWDAAYDAGYRSSRGETEELAQQDWPTDGTDPEANLRYGCGYLELCYERCRNSNVYSGDALKNTLSSYNQGWPTGPIKGNEDSYVDPIINNYENYKRKIMYHVDMGDLDDETSHNLVGWGDSQVPPDNPYVSPSGDKTKRYQTLQGDNSVDFSLKKTGISYVLTFEVEDGNCDDSFEVWIGYNNLGYYKGKKLGSAEIKGYEEIIPKEYITDTKAKIAFKNKASDNCGLAAVYNVKLTPQQQIPVAVDVVSIGTVTSSNEPLAESSITSSVIGEWTLHSRLASDFIPSDSTITFYTDHTLRDTLYGKGTWSQSGNSIRWEYNLCLEEICTRFKTTYDGTIGIGMKGTMQTCDGEEGDWSADRRFADPGILA